MKLPVTQLQHDHHMLGHIYEILLLE